MTDSKYGTCPQCGRRGYPRMNHPDTARLEKLSRNWQDFDWDKEEYTTLRKAIDDSPEYVARDAKS
jgi:PHP family Zn ribbon phosphoesterase